MRPQTRPSSQASSRDRTKATHFDLTARRSSRCAAFVSSARRLTSAVGATRSRRMIRSSYRSECATRPCVARQRRESERVGAPLRDAELRGAAIEVHLLGLLLVHTAQIDDEPAVDEYEDVSSPLNVKASPPR